MNADLVRHKNTISVIAIAMLLMAIFLRSGLTGKNGLRLSHKFKGMPRLNCQLRLLAKSRQNE